MKNASASDLGATAIFFSWRVVVYNDNEGELVDGSLTEPITPDDATADAGTATAVDEKFDTPELAMEYLYDNKLAAQALDEDWVLVKMTEEVIALPYPIDVST